MHLVILPFFLVAISAPLISGALRRVVTSSRLPKPVYGHSAVYDGQDTVFLLAGAVNVDVLQEHVVKYSLSTGDVEELGFFMHLPVYGGVAILRGHDHGADSVIDYIGGISGQEDGFRQEIGRYAIGTDSYSMVGHLPSTLGLPAAAWDDASGVAYLFGGQVRYGSGQLTDHVLAYNTSSLEVRQVSQFVGARYALSAVWDSRRGVAYAFGGYGEDRESPVREEVLEFDPASGETRIIARLPYPVEDSCAVFGDEAETGTAAAYVITHENLIKFSPAAGSNRTEELHVDNWPDSTWQTACVYIPKYHRIYIFGGGVWMAGRDEISYIDLTE